MNYKLFILLFTASQVLGMDEQPAALREVIDKCTATAQSFLVQDRWIDGLTGNHTYRCAISDENELAIQTAVFALAQAIRRKELSWLAWGRQALCGADWQVKPTIGIVALLHGEGLELAERVHGSYKPELLIPYFDRVLTELRTGWKLSRCDNDATFGSSIKLTKKGSKTFEETFGLHGMREADIFNAVLKLNGYSGAQVGRLFVGALSPRSSFASDTMWSAVVIKTSDFGVVERVFGIPLKVDGDREPKLQK